ncbi:hypothetical protein ACRAWD_04380 [Caulobacter segnis]
MCLLGDAVERCSTTATVAISEISAHPILLPSMEESFCVRRARDELMVLPSLRRRGATTVYPAAGGRAALCRRPRSGLGAALRRADLVRAGRRTTADPRRV